MAEVENVKIDSSDAEAVMLELNNAGERIIISPDDTAMFDRFATGIRRIIEMVDEMSKKLSEIEKQYKGKEDYRSRAD